MSGANNPHEAEKAVPQDAPIVDPEHYGNGTDRSSQDDMSDKLSKDSNAENAKSPERSRTKILLIMLALCLAVFLGALDITIVTTALPTISEYFHSQTAYTWVGSAYLLGVSATAIVWGKVSDVFGRKPVLLMANGIFFIGSLIAALSVNVPMLLAARAIQGWGCAGLNTLVNICVGDLFSPRERGAYYGVIGGVWAVALSLGPIIGGAFTQGVSWRWCFYINLPFDGLAFIIILLYLDLKTPKTPLLEGLKAIDWVGALLSIGGTLMFLFGLSFGGEKYPWDSAAVICLVIFGVICWALCFLWEAFGARYPMLPTRIFSQRSNLAVLGVCHVQSFVYIAATYYLPLYFQAVIGAGPVLSGVYLVPTGVSLSVASITTGIYMRKSGQYLPAMLVGFFLQTIGYGLFIDLGPTANWAKIIIFQIIAGLGVGPNFQAPMVALQSHVSPRDIATATSAFAFTRTLSGSVSVVIGQVVFQNEVRKRQGTLISALGPQLAAQLGGGDAGAQTKVIHALPTDQRTITNMVFANSLTRDWIMYTAYSAVGLLVCFFVGRNKLTRNHKETETGLEAEKKARQERLQEEHERKHAKSGKADV